MKNRRELLKAIPFLVAAPLIGLRPKSEISEGIFQQTAASETRVKAASGVSEIPINPWDVAVLLARAPEVTTRKIHEYIRNEEGSIIQRIKTRIEINGKVYLPDPGVPVVTDCGKKLRAKFLGAEF